MGILNLGGEGWRQYLGVLRVGTWWDVPKRGTGGDPKFLGNFIPEIPRQLIDRFTQPGDLVVDLFAGSETTADVCSDSRRRYRGCDLRPRSDRTDRCDARLYNPGEQAQLIIMHPPYANIIDYNERLSPAEGDLSLPWREFLVDFEDVADAAIRICKPGGIIALVIGDLYTKGEYIRLGNMTADVIQTRARSLKVKLPLKAEIVKNFGSEVANKGKNANLWFLRALRGDFFVQEHEHVFVWKKGD